jgi:hypothetical protein
VSYNTKSKSDAERPHSPNTLARLAERPGAGGPPNLTLIENMYKACERCGHSLGCTCKTRPGSRHTRSRSGEDKQHQQLVDEVTLKVTGGSSKSARAYDSEGDTAEHSDLQDGEASERAVSASTRDETDEERDEEVEAPPLPEDVLYLMIALYAFAGDGDSQLPLARDMIVQVLAEANEDGWAYGRNEKTGDEGYFPINYCVVHQKTAQPSTNKSAQSPKMSCANQAPLNSATLKAHVESSSQKSARDVRAALAGSSDSAGTVRTGAEVVVLSGKIVKVEDKEDVMKQAQVARCMIYFRCNIHIDI